MDHVVLWIDLESALQSEVREREAKYRLLTRRVGSGGGTGEPTEGRSRDADVGSGCVRSVGKS